MTCPSCGFENPDGAKYCGSCGGTLFKRCPNCGSDNPFTFNFCSTCGTDLSRVTRDSTPTAPPRGPEAERRQITVMFCDMVGSTALSLKVDPEEFREIVREVQAVVARVVDQFEGYVAQYLGDGMLIYFGYPVAHEQEAERAVRAGLGILARVKKLARQLAEERDIDVSVRIGIHTGMAVIGEVGAGSRREQLAMGDVPNIAARFQGIATPGTLVISRSTCRLVSPMFICEPLGTIELKGVPEPEPAYRVIAEREIEGLLEELARQREYAPIGREQELGLVLHRWQHTSHGQGQVVSICGEPGIGKSHLVRAFRQHLVHEPHVVLECRCSAYHEHSMFHPVIELFRRVLNFYPDQPKSEQLEMIVLALERNGFTLSEAVPLLADLLSVPLADRFAPLTLAPQVKKEKTLDLLLELLEEMAGQQPIVLVVEDLHWADSSTLDLVSRIVDQGPTVPILTLLTYRPTFHPSWPHREHIAQINLARLHQAQVEQIVLQITEGKKLPTEVLRQVVDRTDGVPLFVEELTKMVLESDLMQEKSGHFVLSGPLPPLAIPATLQDSLMARLDRLSTVKEVAQQASVLGRDFTYNLLRVTMNIPEEALRRALTMLVDAELLYQRGVPPRATYVFKHALIQEAAYQSLLKHRRQAVHKHVAEVLQLEFKEVVDTQPELVAHHYTEAGLYEKAVPFWHRAAQYALERSANKEAVLHVNRGLEILEAMPQSAERDRLELYLLMILGPALIMTKGYVAPEVDNVYTRALILSRELGETSQIFPGLVGLFEYSFVRSDIPTARRIADQLMLLAKRTDEPLARLVAHLATGCCMVQVGDVVEAHEHLQAASALYDPVQHAQLAAVFGQDLGVTALSYDALALWGQGRFDQARENARQSLELARRTGHAHTLAASLSFTILLYFALRDTQQLEVLLNEVSTLAREQSFVHWRENARAYSSWLHAARGHREEALKVMEECCALMRSSNPDKDLPYQKHLEAEVFRALGDVKPALMAVNEAIQSLERTRLHWMYHADLYRLRADLLMATSGPESEIEQSIEHALVQARSQQMLTWELNATISLARLRKRQDRIAEAHALLSDVYGRFTEGFDVPIMQEARTLLDQLQPAAPSETAELVEA